MGSKADFYVGTGPTAEWLGSISFDGYPDGDPGPIFGTKTEEEYRKAVDGILNYPDTVSTFPEEGWPWPWKDSRETSYAYAWCPDGVVRLSHLGRPWQTLSEFEETQKDSGRFEKLPVLGDDEVRNMTGLAAVQKTALAKAGFSLWAVTGRVTGKS